MHRNVVNIVSWNMAHRQDSWGYLLDKEIDIALLQGACRPPDDVAAKVEVDPAP